MPTNGTLTFLGTGTSQGVPVIGCDCPVCTSNDPRDQRLRTSALLEVGAVKLLFDIGPDFRQQMLRAGFSDIEAILMTHEHNDHLVGLDDVRPINFLQNRNMPIYTLPRVCRELEQRFAYVFEHIPYPGAPMVTLHPIHFNSHFEVAGIPVVAIRVEHGRLPILGFRIGDFAYLTDVKTVQDEAFALLRGTRFLVLNALRHQEHHSHLTLEEALAFVERLQPEQTYLTHLSHYFGRHQEWNPKLPAGVQLAYDGLKWRFPL